MALRRVDSLVGVCALALCCSLQCSADSWGPPQLDHWSANHRFVLRVTWPGNGLTLFRWEGEGAPEVLWSRAYVDDTSPPHAAYVADDGKHVVLRDVHGALGFGKVLVFLDENGEILRSYELAELLTQKEILETSHTSSSVWWSEPGWFSFLEDDKLFAFVTHHGSVQCFNVARGTPVDLDDATRTKVRSRAIGDVAAMLKDKDARRREAGATLAGALHAAEFVPDFKALLQDRAVTVQQMSSGGWCDYPGVQVAAARAMAILIGKEVVPLIEPLLCESHRGVRRDLMSVIAGIDEGMDGIRETPDSAYLLSVWHRLMESPLEDVREYATEAVLEREQGEYVLDRPGYLDDPDDTIRYLAVRALAERGDERAVPFLRKALGDRYSPTQTWAFRGMVKYRPPDILTVLHDGMSGGDEVIQGIALGELVRRGDKAAIDLLREKIARLEQHTHDCNGWQGGEWEAEGLCTLVAELRADALEPELRRAYRNGCEGIRRPVCGALAALGDRNALMELHAFALRGDVLDRVSSIQMIGLAGDRASLPTLRSALADREPWIRQAAQEAIARIEE